MRISVFNDSREMMGYCKMAWLGNFKYKIHFFQTYNNGLKIKIYFVFSTESEEVLGEKEQALLELWKEKEPDKAERAFKDFETISIS